MSQSFFINPICLSASSSSSSCSSSSSSRSSSPISFKFPFSLELGSPVSSFGIHTTRASKRTDAPILTLSNEILTQIIFHLDPREAIYLSLTCRRLYHGVLSPDNRYLWYRVGRFAETMPGYKAEWEEFFIVPEVVHDPIQQPANSYDNGDQQDYPAPPTDRRYRCSHGLLPLEASWETDRQLLNEKLKVYNPAGMVDYKQILMEAMLGDADTGCQWCLQRPTGNKVYKGWGLRLCRTCFNENHIFVKKCKYLYAFGLDLSHLPLQCVSNMSIQYQSHRDALWKPSVRNLVSSKTSKSIEVLLTEYRVAAKEAFIVFYDRHTTAILTAIRQKYTTLYEKYSSIGFRDSDSTSEDFKFFVRAMEKIPPEKLKSEWFVQDMSPELSSAEWKNNRTKDSLMRYIVRLKRERWQEIQWVDAWAERKVMRMQRVFSAERLATFQPSHYNIFTRSMLSDVVELAHQWHLSRARSKGADMLMTRASEGDTKGLICPGHTSGCSPTPHKSLEGYLLHLEEYHRQILIGGDTDWLFGEPSQFWSTAWTVTLEKNSKTTGNDHKKWYRRLRKYPTNHQQMSARQQELWLKKWWPDRWKEKNTSLLKEWANNEKFHVEHNLTLVHVDPDKPPAEVITTCSIVACT